MQDIVDQMGSPEAKSFLPGWLLSEGKKGCQIKISNKLMNRWNIKYKP